MKISDLIISAFVLLNTIFCQEETSSQILDIYKLENYNYLFQHKFTFQIPLSKSYIKTIKNFPMPFLHFASETNFTEYSFHLVQGRWEDFMKPYFSNVAQPEDFKQSFKNAIYNFKTYDGGLSLQIEKGSDMQKIINFVSGFICSGIERLMKNVCEIEIPIMQEDNKKFIYAHDPMNYLCYDNLIHLLQMIYNPYQGYNLAKMFEKQAFSTSLYTQLDIKQRNFQSKTELEIKITFVSNNDIISQKSLAVFPIFNNDGKLIVNLHHFNQIIPDLEITQITPLKTILLNLAEKKAVSANFDDLIFRRVLTGVDHELYARYSLDIKNTKDQNSVAFIQEFFPHFIKPYFHTLSISRFDKNGNLILVENIKPLKIQYNEKSDCFFSLGEIKINKNEEIKITMEIEKLMLPFEEYSHDSSRGFDLPAMIFWYKMDNENDIHETYSPSIVLMLAQPDFSMPFNVHALYCVLVGVFFKLYLNIIDTITSK